MLRPDVLDIVFKCNTCDQDLTWTMSADEARRRVSVAVDPCEYCLDLARADGRVTAELEAEQAREEYA